MATIETAIDRAIADADNELVGLGNRLDDARSRAAFLYGDVIDGEADNGKSTAMVEEAERFLVRGERRREELARHREVLEDLKRRVGSAIGALAAEKSEG